MTRKKPKVVTISGRAGAGKDTFANMLKDKLERAGERVLITHYADLVKYICTTFFDWDGKKDERGREMLQTVGTDIVRRQDPDYWVRFVENIITFFPVWDYILIPDARFENEIERMKERFDVTSINVDRVFKSQLTEKAQAHESEHGLDGYAFDIIVYNDDSLEQLRNAAGVVAGFLKDGDQQIEINRRAG